MNVKATDREGKGASKIGWVHFGIAAGVLLIAVSGFAVAVQYLEGALHKEPVPWPEGTRVSDDFRLLGFPRQFGPTNPEGGSPRFRLLEREGETVLEDDILDSLGIGRPIDGRRLPHRMSNWYMIRRYEDTAQPEDSPYRYWQLEAYYYTGEHRTVPHVPERCLPAAGAEPVSGRSGSVNFAVSGLSHAGSAWDDGPLRFQRAAYSTTTGRMQQDRLMAVYYVFSFNGEPEHSWEAMRRHLVSPWIRYSYFAKVQFAPLGPGDIEDFDEADGAAEEFVSHALPHVLEHFPTVEDVRALSEREASDQQDES